MLTEGFWHTNFWCEDFWDDNFWPEYGTAVFAGGQPWLFGPKIKDAG